MHINKLWPQFCLAKQLILFLGWRSLSPASSQKSTLMNAPEHQPRLGGTVCGQQREWPQTATHGVPKQKIQRNTVLEVESLALSYSDSNQFFRIQGISTETLGKKDSRDLLAFIFILIITICWGWRQIKGISLERGFNLNRVRLKLFTSDEKGSLKQAFLWQD